MFKDAIESLIALYKQTPLLITVVAFALIIYLVYNDMQITEHRNIERISRLETELKECQQSQFAIFDRMSQKVEALQDKINQIERKRAKK